MKHVLLIDDDALYREGIAQLFAPDEYRFSHAGSPTEGIRLLDADPSIQVVLLDLSFPGRSGTAVLEHVRERSDEYRVIVLTAHDELLAAKRAREYAVFNYLPKAAQHSSDQALRFSLEQAFKDLDRAALALKIMLLQEVQRRISAERDPRPTLDLICESVRKIVGAYTCHIRVYDFKLGDFHLMGFGPDGPLRRAFEVPRAKGALFSGKVVETGRPEHCDDLQHDEEFLSFKRKALEGGGATPEVQEYWESVSSAYIVPISTGIYGDAVDAVLNVSSRSVGFFDVEKCTLVDEFVHQASLAITKDWLQRKRDELHEDYGQISRMLTELRNSLTGRGVMRGIYRNVTRELARLVSAEVVSIFVQNERTGRIENIAEFRGTRHEETPDESYEVGQSFVGTVFEMEETLQLPKDGDGVKPLEDRRYDHTDVERYEKIIPSGTLNHYLGVPIKAGGEIQGVLRVMNKKSTYYEKVMEGGRERNGNGEAPLSGRHCLLERGFSLDCRNVVEITASHLAIAIQNARLLEKTARQVEQLKTLGKVGQLISSELDIQSVLSQTISNMAMVMQAEICMLFLKEDGEDRLVLKQSYGIPETEIPGASYAIGEGATGRVAASGKAKLIRKSEENNGKYDAQIRRYLTERDGRPREIESLMVVPITAKDRTLGVMKVINKLGDEQYGRGDLALFRTFGQVVGVAIENAQIYELANQKLAFAERNVALARLVKAVAHQINNTSGVIPSNVAALKVAIGATNREITSMLALLGNTSGAAPSDVAALKEAIGSTNDKVTRMLALIERVAKRALAFVKELEEFWLAPPDVRQPMEINEIVRTMIEELEYELPKYRNAETIRILPALDDPLVCEVSETSFPETVKIILVNAVQALENTHGGVIRVSTSPGVADAEGSAILCIEDNGPGISPKHLPRIFDPDFGTKKRGYGFGLWFARTKVEQLGGKIEVESEPGRGARFIITIPLAKSAAPEP
jgi:signal transduction histidine kinase/DNA-binding NarL/FixJ family response regulator